MRVFGEKGGRSEILVGDDGNFKFIRRDSFGFPIAKYVGKIDFLHPVEVSSSYSLQIQCKPLVSCGK